MVEIVLIKEGKPSMDINDEVLIIGGPLKGDRGVILKLNVDTHEDWVHVMIRGVIFCLIRSTLQVIIKEQDYVLCPQIPPDKDESPIFTYKMETCVGKIGRVYMVSEGNVRADFEEFGRWSFKQSWLVRVNLLWNNYVQRK